MAEPSITIVGIGIPVQKGDQVKVQGQWGKHPVHGKQFKIDTMQLELPTNTEGIIHYLSTVLKGVGRTYAERIVDRFGEYTLEILDSDSSRLSEVKGLGPKRIEAIQEQWAVDLKNRQQLLLCYELGLGTKLAHRVIQHYQDQTVFILKTNPYRLIQDIWGVGFVVADRIARQAGIPEDSPLRIRAGLLDLITIANQSGHVCVNQEGLFESAIQRFSVSDTLIQTEYAALIESGDLVAVSGKVWPKELRDAEQRIAMMIQGLQSTPTARLGDPGTDFLQRIQDDLSMQYSEQQSQAILSSLSEKCLLITGGPGTGKSSIIRAIAYLYKVLLKKEVNLAASTGRAAKRLQALSGFESSTIHRLLQPDFKNMQFKFNQTNPLDCDLMIIDEASMVDTLLMQHLLAAIPPTSRLLIVGDSDQLPSVGPGTVFKDMIESKTIPCIYLDQVYRQAEGSQIIQCAHMILKKERPSLGIEKSSDFFFLKRQSVTEIQDTILDLYLRRLPEKYQWSHYSDIQILAPQRRGDLGVHTFNEQIQKRLKPRSARQSIFYEGDKVIQLKNNYEKGIYNGDIGQILSIENGVLDVAFDDQQIEYTNDEWEELQLAYAVTVHKYQGSECPAVIMPVHSSHSHMLYQNLLYTAVSRAKELLVLVGDPEAFFRAIQRTDVNQRLTGLKQSLIATMGAS